MKVSYKILKSYLPYLENAEKTAQDLIMHTAEVEEIIIESENLKDVYIWEILSCEKHPESEKLNICKVSILWEIKQIVCWASNVKPWIKVPVAVIWAQLSPDFVIAKTKIRGEISEWMICSLDELGLVTQRQEWIWEMPIWSELWISLRTYLWKNDEILEIDNKAINHRPDMFSYMWVLREIATIHNKNIELEYKNIDFSVYPELKAKNEIPEIVKRYSLLKISWVWNIKSREEIQTIIEAAGHGVKWLLVDVSNYSLYFYGQPAHIFDADKIDGNITVRYAKNWETLDTLDDKTYQLSDKDIVIADSTKVLALWGIIWWKYSAVSDTTRNIIIETAHFDQAVLRMTGKRLWVRTDALNVFEKDILTDLAQYATALIVDELLKEFPKLKIESYFDSYIKKQTKVQQMFDLDFYNNLIGASYKEDYVVNILHNLWIKKNENELIIPFWRKELTTKADIAEEIARIDGYDKIITTVPRVNLWAIIQDPIYYLKNDSKKFFTDRWFYDVYNYSFVNISLLEKLNLNINNCVPLKNYLSEDSTHMKNSLIPNLMKGLEDNIRDKKDIKLFEIEKVFYKNGTEVSEDYRLSWVMTSVKELVYYDIQKIVSDFLKTVFVDNFYFETTSIYPEYSHAGRVAKIIVRWKEVWYVWEIHPNIAKKFDINERVWFFDIEVSKLIPNLYSKTKATELSTFQENNFDLSFVVDKNIKWREIALAIQSTNKELIKKVELFDIYENEEKLPGKRSLSFKVFIQSMTETLKDDVKWNLIKDIVSKVEKKWWSLR